jgi:tetratricopeptide (TPR) repeat protein
MRRGTLAVALMMVGLAPMAQAQDLMSTMNMMATSLGVTCDYCHSAPRGSGLPEPKKAIARQMMAMTRELNTQVQTATGKAAGTAIQVDCATCHRGVAVPRPLQQILLETLQRDGTEAAITQYRDLRKMYYGRAAYDFGEDALLNFARRIVEVRPAESIKIIEAHLELFPESAKGYDALGYAYTRVRDDEAAIKALEKSIELDSTNGVVRGRLEQLRSYQRRR